MHLVLVHGTHGRADAWHRPGSRLRDEAETRGFVLHDFRWSGDLAGIPTTLPGDPDEAANGADHGRLLPWLDAGEKLCLYLASHRLLSADPPPCALTHSDGLQVLTYAAVRFARFAVAVSVAGPIRRDMLRARRLARDRIGQWIQFADPEDDAILRAGKWFDGGPLGGTVALPEGVTILTPGLGHHGLLQDPAARTQYALWDRFVPVAVPTT